MSDDYLWDRSGPPDPDVVALERALAGVDPESAMPTSTLDVHVLPTRSRVVAIAMAAAAVLVLALGGWWWSQREQPLSMRTTTPIAMHFEPPTLADDELGGTGGECLTEPPTDAPQSAPKPEPRAPERPDPRWIETGADASRTIEIAALGRVELDPHTRMRELEGAPGEHRYELARGRIHASVVAPPRVFVVETPSSVAVDLGCQYTLEVDERGSTRLEVSVGFVALERGGRECIVPAGSSCEARKGGKVGTTVRLEASPALRKAVATIDRGGARARAAALATVLREASAADLATLWHLLRYADADERPALFDRLAVLTTPPENVDREAVLAGDDAMLLAWWDELGLGRRGFRSPK